MSQQTLKIHPLVYAGALAVLVLGVLPLRTNWKFNNFSKNWLNNDYAKNLLASTEEYSVFMTEGGDNQVFGSLYFTYAVKLRQDLFPYDQKGNIFKRIYGDMRYVTADIVDSRMQSVDQGLFSGQEPFYEFIRTSNPPYLVPYALGRPTVYLTWKRTRQFTLGDYYYKPYGMMFKVQPIRYAMIDMLAVVGTASFDQLRDRASKDLGRAVADGEARSWISDLAREGLLRVEGNKAVFRQDYPKPFTRDPRSTFITRWEGISNLPYYDYLSREIVISYAYESLIYWNDRVKEMEYLYKADQNAESRAALKEQIDKAWQEIDKMITLGKYVGYDSPSILHNIGILMLSFEQSLFAPRKKEIFKEAVELWRQGVEQFPYGWGTYNVLLWGSMQAAYRYPEDAQKYLDIFDGTLVKMTNAMKHWSSMKKDITKAEPYRQAQGLIQERKAFNPNKTAQLSEEQKMLEADVDRGALDLGRAQMFIQTAVGRLSMLADNDFKTRISRYWLKVWNLKKRDPEYLQWHVQLLLEASQAGDLIEPRLYDVTLKEAPGLIPSPAANNRDLNALVALTKLASNMGDRITSDTLLKRIYRDAKVSLPPAEYEKLKVQIDAFAEAL